VSSKQHLFITYISDGLPGSWSSDYRGSGRKLKSQNLLVRAASKTIFSNSYQTVSSKQHLFITYISDGLPGSWSSDYRDFEWKTKISNSLRLNRSGWQNYFLQLIPNGVLKTAPFYNIYFRRITGVLEFGLPRFELKTEIAKPLGPCGQQNYFSPVDTKRCPQNSTFL
jgi:hypothetical protein